jgi:DNA-binding NtrC family response regulator
MLNVLVVDDDANLREILAIALEDDFNVRTAASGAEALRLVAKTLPDALVLDQHMPGMDGLAVLEHLAAGPGVPGTLLMSAGIDIELARRALALGVRDFLPKPFSVSSLKQKVQEATVQAHRWRSKHDPLALRSARALFHAGEGGGDLEKLSLNARRVLVQEALWECRGERTLAAERLALLPKELERMQAEWDCIRK